MKYFCFSIMIISSLFIQQSTSVEVYRVEKENAIEVFARNNNIYPVTIELQLHLNNLKPDKNLPYITTLNASNNQKLLNLTFEDKVEGWEYRSSYRFYMGSIFARHNNSFAYRLPFPVGDEYRVDQGFGGRYSHQGDLQHALDFNMPEGTAIYAARQGKVVLMEEQHNQGGASEDMMGYANYITILHDDGTFADYSHLRHQGVEVELGQQVRMGQLIGYSGATGFATGPHLHFVVKKTKRGGGFISIPVKFATTKGIHELDEGESYVGY